MKLSALINNLQDFYLLCFRGLLGILSKNFRFRDAVEQMDYAGVGSLAITTTVLLFVGMALSLQLSAELTLMGLTMYTGQVVGISVVREIGPVITALVFAGRAGSGMASEIGSMVLGHQVDTLRVFGVEPVGKLVTPRILSAVLMLPVLTVIGDTVALLGAYYIAVFVNHQSGTVFWSSMRYVLTYENVIAGATKPFAFGYLIACVSCYMGLSTKGGSIGLRSSTTKSFALSVIVIIIADFVLTKALLYLLGYSQ